MIRMKSDLVAAVHDASNQFWLFFVNSPDNIVCGGNTVLFFQQQEFGDDLSAFVGIDLDTEILFGIVIERYHGFI